MNDDSTCWVSVLVLVGALMVACGSDGESSTATGDDPESPGIGTDFLVSSCAGEASSAGTTSGVVGDLHAVGDSILGWNKEEQASIPDVVGRTLGASMLNNATGGAELLGEEGISSQYVSAAYSHVLINGGGNDFARACTQAVLDGIIASDLQSGQLVNLVDQVLRDGGQSVIVGYYVPRDRQGECTLFPELLRRYRRLAMTRSDVVYVCTLETITPQTGALYADEVHPSVEGSRVIGELIAGFIRPDA